MLFDCLTGLASVPDDKCLRYLATIDSLLEGPPSSKLLDKHLGSMVWASLIFPTIQKFTPFSFAFQGALTSSRLPLPLPPRVREELLFLKSVLTSCPRSRVAALTASSPEDAAVIVHVDWAPAERGVQQIGIAVLSHGLYAITQVPDWFLEAYPVSIGVDGSSNPSSPTFEAFCVVSYLACFPDLAANQVSFIYTDNDPFLLRSSLFTSSGSPSMDAALKLGALSALSLNAHIVVQRVPTDLNISNWLTHSQMPKFQQALKSAGISRQFWPRSPVLPTLPSSWILPLP